MVIFRSDAGGIEWCDGLLDAPRLCEIPYQKGDRDYSDDSVNVAKAVDSLYKSIPSSVTYPPTCRAGKTHKFLYRPSQVLEMFIN